MRNFFVAVPIALLAIGGSTACATKKFVRTSVGEVNEKVDSQGRALEAALKALAAFDANSHGPHDLKVRAALVASAAQALWQFVVQREACGLRDSGAMMRMYGVPAEVRDRMGVFPPGRP